MKECCCKYLDEQFGDPDIVAEIYEEYVRSVGEKIADAQSALDARKWSELDRAAHTIKGNSLAAGDTEMANLAIAMRNSANLQDAKSAENLLNGIIKLAEEL